MTQDDAFTDEYILDLTHRLRGGAVRRNRAAAELAEIDLERFERPPQIALLLAALNAPVLRDRARESLTRVLRGADDADLECLGLEERLALRRSIGQAKPYVHAAFMLVVVHTLLSLRDVDAIPLLERLVERTRIFQEVARVPVNKHGMERRMVSSFQGTREEEHNMRRVHSAAHVACERLKLCLERSATGAHLLRPASASEAEQLLLPASPSGSNPEYLLRSLPAPDKHA